MIFYAFIFTITRQEDFALLLGSIGLFLVIAILMFVTRKVKWYTSK
jgi:inner membrane protein